MNQAAPEYRLLGGYRLLLATCVMLSHGLAALLGGPETVLRLGLGNVGVFLFFVLSGFVISEALERFYGDSPGRFLVNRLLKIMPSYWAALAATIAIWWAIQHPSLAQLTPRNLLGNLLLFGGDLRISSFQVIEIAWSLIIEMEFYIAAALLYLAIGRTRAAGYWLAGAALFGMASSMWIVETGTYFRFYGPLFYAPFFVLGAGLYQLDRGVRPRGPTLAITGIALATSTYAYARYIERVPVDLFGSLALAGAFLVLLVVLSRIHRPTLRVWDSRLGDITYFVYLVHFAFIDASRWFATGRIDASRPRVPDEVSGSAAVLAMILCTLAASVLLHATVERPLRHLRNRLRGRPLVS